MKRKIVAFNGSPNSSDGNTGFILSRFIEGLKEGSADVTLFNLVEMDISPCRGDLACWLRTDGDCIQNDDMIKILPEMQEADIILFATPLYVDGMTGILKNAIDRMIPLVLPFVEVMGENMWHPWRSEKKDIKIALISTCGFWKIENFDPLVTHVKAMAKNFSAEYAGAILRPHAPAFIQMHKMGAPVDDIIHAIKNAGKELAETGKMKDSDLQMISRPVLERDEYVDRLNDYFGEILEKKGKIN
jgi:multimeric flavodoxin WrbA